MKTRERKSPTLRRSSKRRQVDFEIITDWIETGSRVLDLGCGRGILLEALTRQKKIYGLGVDVSPAKISSCLKRGVNAYQGEAEEVLGFFPEGAFDYVIFSRTIEMVDDAGEVLKLASRVGRNVIVGFINHGFWRNRLAFLLGGRHVLNDVYPFRWEEASPYNPLSIAQFREFCRLNGLAIRHETCLAGDWEREVRTAAGWRSGYAIFSIGRG